MQFIQNTHLLYAIVIHIWFNYVLVIPSKILLKTFSINVDALPSIRSSSEVFGIVCDGSILDGIQISGVSFANIT